MSISTTVDLPEIFKTRRNIISVELNFENIVPTRDRFQDVITTLKDLGVVIEKGERDIRQEGQRLYTSVDGWKIIGPTKAKIKVFIEGTKRKAERTISVDGRYIGRTTVETGGIKITVRASHNDFQQLMLLMARFMELIKERFAPFIAPS